MTDVETLTQRVAELTALPEGWLNGEGEQVSPALADQFLATLTTLADTGHGLPFVYPTEDGGLRAEWDLGDREAVWQLDPGGTFGLIRHRDTNEIILEWTPDQ